MFNKITAQDILLAHVYVCHSLGLPAELNNAKVLRDIETQLNSNLSWFSPVELAAYVGLQLVKLKPFAYANKATATAVAMAIFGRGKNLNAQQVLEALETSSIVDEVADRLLLVGAK